METIIAETKTKMTFNDDREPGNDDEGRLEGLKPNTKPKKGKTRREMHEKGMGERSTYKRNEEERCRKRKWTREVHEKGKEETKKRDTGKEN